MILALAVLLGPVATWITAGLDTKFHWSDGMPRLAFIAGVVVTGLRVEVQRANSNGLEHSVRQTQLRRERL